MSDDLLARSWDQAAEGYARYFTPRFRPGIEAAQAELIARVALLPAGPVLFPACGPGTEIAWIARHLPERMLIGLDLSPGMIEVARRELADVQNVELEAADCRTLSNRFAGTAGAIVSSFGLQQMPKPDEVIADWTRTLAPGGILSVVCWPRSGDDDGPGAVIRRLLANRVPQPDASWQERLVPAVQAAGGEVLADRPVAFRQEHESAEIFFDAMTEWGPMRALRLRHGEPFVAELRAEFLRDAAPGPLSQVTIARLLVAQRRPV